MKYFDLTPDNSALASLSPPPLSVCVCVRACVCVCVCTAPSARESITAQNAVKQAQAPNEISVLETIDMFLLKG